MRFTENDTRHDRREGSVKKKSLLPPSVVPYGGEGGPGKGKHGMGDRRHKGRRGGSRTFVPWLGFLLLALAKG